MPAPDAVPPPPPRGDDADTERTVVPVIAEELDVDILEHTTGRVRVATRTETVEHDIEETLGTLTAEVRRVPIERELGPDEPVPETRVENNVTVIPVVEERLVIEKRLVLVEEIRVERRHESETVKVPVTVRRQRVDVERLPEDSSDPHGPVPNEVDPHRPDPREQDPPTDPFTTNERNEPT